MARLQLFLAHSFANEPWNHRGEYDYRGVTDLKLAERVKECITRFSDDRIEVIQTKDPLRSYITTDIRKNISSADAVLCLFTKRIKDHLRDLWIPSTYVISEAAAALMHFESARGALGRLFGLMEEGVDASQLGLAFHENQAVPRFSRDDLAQLDAHVKRIVDAILFDTPPPPLQAWEYLSINKTATIFRSGAVRVETRHRYRAKIKLSQVRMSHTMWRVSRPLPTTQQLIDKPGPRKHESLHVMLVHCSGHERDSHRCKIVPGPSSDWAFERNFFVDLVGPQENPAVDFEPGQELEYEIAWTYPNAFHGPGDPETSPDKPNSVGLTTGKRGVAASVSLTLQFQRDLDGEPDRVLEVHPRVSTIRHTQFPGRESPEQFFHHSDEWEFCGELKPCPKRSTIAYKVYHWSAGRFTGMVKATFVPHLNYFGIPEPSETPPPNEPAPRPQGDASGDFQV